MLYTLVYIYYYIGIIKKSFGMFSGLLLHQLGLYIRVSVSDHIRRYILASSGCFFSFRDCIRIILYSLVGDYLGRCQAVSDSSAVSMVLGSLPLLVLLHQLLFSRVDRFRRWDFCRVSCRFRCFSGGELLAVSRAGFGIMREPGVLQ